MSTEVTGYAINVRGVYQCSLIVEIYKIVLKHTLSLTHHENIVHYIVSAVTENLSLG